MKNKPITEILRDLSGSDQQLTSESRFWVCVDGNILSADVAGTVSQGLDPVVGFILDNIGHREPPPDESPIRLSRVRIWSGGEVIGADTCWIIPGHVTAFGFGDPLP